MPSMSSRSMMVIDEARRVARVLESGLVTTNVYHSHIHDGILFDHSEIDLALASAASIELLLVTHATMETNMLVGAVAGGDSQVFLYEGTTVSAAGAARTPILRNRRLATVFGGTLTAAPTVTDDGTLIHQHLLPGGNDKTAGGGQLLLFQEFVLAASTTYLIRMTNITALAHVADLTPIFYELTPL